MLRNVVVAVVVALTLLVLGDAMRHHRPARPAPTAAEAGGPPTATITQTSTGATGPARNAAGAVADQPIETPAFDMMTRLATRRRIAREGNQVYLDSMFAKTDSVVTRWYERTSLTVAFIADSSLKRWSPALIDEARAGMHAWDNGGAGMTFHEIANADSADVTVQWADTVPDSGQVGVTTVQWGRDGAIHGATITLALRHNTDSSVVPAATRARVAIHEFGHALGLPHSDSRDDIMYRNSPVPEPSTRDQATLRLLYALFPGSLRVQP